MNTPAKRWRVAVGQLGSSDHSSQKAAYDIAREWQESGHWVTIRHWEDGRWGLYERLQPSLPAGSGEVAS